MIISTLEIQHVGCRPEARSSDAAALTGVEAARRLIEEQDLRVERERSGRAPAPTRHAIRKVRTASWRPSRFFQPNHAQLELREAPRTSSSGSFCNVCAQRKADKLSSTLRPEKSAPSWKSEHPSVPPVSRFSASFRLETSLPATSTCPSAGAVQPQRSCAAAP